jgi:hypothetical protein
MKRSSLPAVLVGLLLLILAGCGGSHPKTTKAPACPPGQSFMGCASGAQAQPAPPAPGHVGVTAPVPGCKFPDVSDWQGHPNWKAAAPYICAGVAKAGEGFANDPDYGYNVTQLRANHIPWSAYWFVRGCNEGPSFVYALGLIGFRGDRDALRPVLDMEVPAARGCAVPMADAIHKAFGVWPIIYAGPGTWPGGSSGGLNVWEADYTTGPLAAMPFAATVLAWQRWAPPYLYYRIPGFAYGDVSVDLRGFAKAFAFPAPAPSKAQRARWTRARNASESAYAARSCPVLAQRIGWYSVRLHGSKVASRRRALHASRTAYRQRSCSTFAQRVRYFDHKLGASA